MRIIKNSFRALTFSITLRRLQDRKKVKHEKVISFIASHYRNDKIWLRRTLPSKRDYRILLAIDDTLSMREGGLGSLQLGSLNNYHRSSSSLGSRKSSCGCNQRQMNLLQTFDETITSERSSFVLSQFGFNYSAPKSADFAMANFIRDANQMLDA
jgi:midasin